MSNNSAPTLLPHHREQLLNGSGIAPDVVEERGYRSVVPPDGYAELKPYGFSRSQANLPGLLLPLWTTDGQNGLMVYRPDTPRVDNNGKTHKYELPKGVGVRLDCPRRCQPLMADPSIPLWITEGQKKADALVSRGLCAIALLGVWNFKGKNPFGGTTVLADFDYIALENRPVRIVFDNDVMTKDQVKLALVRLIDHLQRKGAQVDAVYLPTEGGRKVGVDDYLLEHPVAELEGRIEQPRSQIPTAAPAIEVLSNAPELISRPLALIDGHAYAATWLWVKTTTTEVVGKNGEVLRLSVPRITGEQKLFIQRDDGARFSAAPHGDIQPLSELGVTVHLPEIPLASRLWSAAGFLAYKRGDRAQAARVFAQVVAVVNTFIDFNRSLADQQTMSEMVGCYILSTWFLDAFYVVGFLWPNGDRGSGKTQLLNVVAELSYLGQTILAGGSYACLRDMADYGATLAFDDAENLSDPKRTDPDKRALLLAGNRRGNTVAVKEQGPNGTWHTRHVNTFCPRLFSAIRLPDAVLASRSIVVPLIRTPDRERANADPLDYTKWPHDRSKLIDDLWALALCHLSDLPSYVAQVDRFATLNGRNLEPWRPLLTMARWLNDAGVEGLWERMERLSQAYQVERPDLESADLTVLTIKALCHYATKTTSATNNETPQEWVCTTSDIKTEVVAVAVEEESGLDVDKLSVDRVGRILGRMRFKKKPREGGKGSRQWVIPESDLRGWARVYGCDISQWGGPDTSGSSGISGSSGTDVIGDDDVVELATGIFHQSRMPCFVETVEREPEPSPPSSEMLQSPAKGRQRKSKAAIIEVGPCYDPGPYRYLTEPSAVAQCLPRLLEQPALGIDVETTGLSPRRDRIRLVQLATPQETVIIDAFQVPVTMLSPLMLGSQVLYGHNLKFEVRMLTAAGLPYPTCFLFDTELMSRVVEANDVLPKTGHFDLQHVSQRYLQETLDKQWQKHPWDGELCDDQLRYAAADAHIMWKLVPLLQAEIDQGDLQRIADLEHACIPALGWLESAGMSVDAEAWLALVEQVRNRKPALENLLNELAHDYVVNQRDGELLNWRSWQQVVPFLQSRGLPVERTAKEVLQPFADDSAVAAFLEWVPLDKKTNAFGDSWAVQHIDSRVGRVYPDFQQLGSRAGRMSCRKPNLQQIPKDLNYRRCFRTQEGKLYVDGDYSQIELRILADLSKDRILLKAFADDLDVHQDTAAKVFHVAYAAATKDMRSKAKTLNFGVIFGQGAKSLAAQTGYTVEEAKAFLETYFSTYRGVAMFKGRQLNVARRTGEVRTILGRRRLLTRIHDRDWEFWYKVKNMTINSPVQGSAADAFKLALVRLYQHRDEVPGSVRLTNLIHDEIVAECAQDDVEVTKAWLHRHMVAAMEEMMQGHVPIKVDLHVGQTWAEEE